MDDTDDALIRLLGYRSSLGDATPEQRDAAFAHAGDEVAGLPRTTTADERAAMERVTRALHAELKALLKGRIARDRCSTNHSKYMAQTQRRSWRAKQRAANPAPLSDKVVYPRRLVEVTPQPKKRGGK